MRVAGVNAALALGLLSAGCAGGGSSDRGALPACASPLPVPDAVEVVEVTATPSADNPTCAVVLASDVPIDDVVASFVAALDDAGVQHRSDLPVGAVEGDRGHGEPFGLAGANRSNCAEDDPGTLALVVAAAVARGERPDEAAVLRLSELATFEFFESDREVARLLFRDAMVLGDGVDRHLAATYEGFDTDIEKAVIAAQEAGHAINGPARLIAVSIAAQVSQLALRRLATDDGVPAEVAADLAVRLLVDGLRPR